MHSTLRVEGYRSWLLSRGLRVLRRAFSPSSCSREDERTRRDKQAGRGRKMHKQDRTNGREFKNGTTGASVGYYFPRWGECGMVARTAVKFCRHVCLFLSLFPFSRSCNVLFYSLSRSLDSSLTLRLSLSNSLCILSCLPFSILQPSFPFCCRAQFKSPPDR